MSAADVLPGATSLYDRDFALWVAAQVEALRAGRFQDLDLANVIEEMSDLSLRQRHALESQFVRLWHHMLKCRFQPERRTPSWDTSIDNAMQAIFRILRDSPSLRPEVPAFAAAAYRAARRRAARETEIEEALFPAEFPLEFDIVEKRMAGAKTDAEIDALIRAVLE